MVILWALTYAEMSASRAGSGSLSGVSPEMAFCFRPVSYTHLDVYKRQMLARLGQLQGQQGIAAAARAHRRPVRISSMYKLGNGLFIQGFGMDFEELVAAA